MKKPNLLVRLIVEKGGKKMLTKLMGSIEGYKTYVLAVLGVVVGLIGVLWGPVDIGPIDIPKLSWGDFWNVVWNGGLFAALRHGVK